MGLSIENYVHYPRHRSSVWVGERARRKRRVRKKWIHFEVIMVRGSADIIAALHERTSFVHDGVFAETLGVCHYDYRIVVGHYYLDVGHILSPFR